MESALICMSLIINNNCPICLKKNITYQRPYGGPPFLSCNDLYQCQDCGLIFAHELPQKEVLDKYYSHGLYYDQVADPYHHDILQFSYKLSQIRLKLINTKIGQFNDVPKVIDIGAGNARFGIALKEFYETAIYETVEPDSGVQNKYGDLVDRHYNDVSDVKDRDYDLIVMNQVLEHLPDPADFLRSVCKLLKQSGYVYIDVPYQDYLFKPTIEPHLLFLNQKSMSMLLEKVKLTMIFCDTAGMPHKQAKRFFNQQNLMQKIRNPWLYVSKINSLLHKIGLPQVFDTFQQFQADKYGGDRQWLRCIAQKTA